MTAAFLKDVNPSILSKVSCITRTYAKGTTVHAQGDPCKGMELVLSGTLVAYALSQNGSENVIFEFSKNSAIGANLIFGNANHYPMNIYCTEDCVLQYLSKSDIENLLNDYNFTLNFIKNISLNSQGMNKKIAMYTQKNLRENIMDYLYAQSAEQQTKSISLTISKKQLADYFGVQRPSLFRELKQLKDEGIIDIDNRQIRILK